MHKDAQGCATRPELNRARIIPYVPPSGVPFTMTSKIARLSSICSHRIGIDNRQLTMHSTTANQRTRSAKQPRRGRVLIVDAGDAGGSSKKSDTLRHKQNPTRRRHHHSVVHSYKATSREYEKMKISTGETTKPITTQTRRRAWVKKQRERRRSVVRSVLDKPGLTKCL